MKKITIFMAIILLLCTAVLFSSCNNQTDGPSNDSTAGATDPFKDEITDKGTEAEVCEHSPGEWTVKVESSCKTEGLKVINCTKCGDEISSEKIPASAHAESDWQIISEPTCVKAGEKITVCTVCNETMQAAEIPKADHKEGEWTLTLEPSCVKEGERSRYCTVCGAIMSSEPIAKTAHAEGNWIVDNAASIGAAGKKHTECSSCHQIISVADIPALSEDTVHTHTGGDWVTVNAPTCTEKGEKVKYCSVCGETLESSEIDESGHTGGEPTVTKAPTCTQTGESVCKCTVCGEVTETNEIPETGHTRSDWITDKEPDVGVPGEKHIECEICGTILKREGIPALEAPHEHTFSEWRISVKPTCTSEGKKVRYCTDTDCGMSETAKLDKTPHPSHVFVKGRPATASANGLSDGLKCGECGNMITEQKVIPPLPTNIQDIDILTDVRYEGYGDGRLMFSWSSAEGYGDKTDRIMVTVSHGEETESYIILRGESTWIYNIVGESGAYTFIFTPITKDNIQGNSMQRICHWYPDISKLDFPRLEITTASGVLPTCDFISPPPGNWGGGTINNEYVGSILRLYSGKDNLLYTSEENGFSGAKIRIRGNTSARGDKQPFKIKLDKKFDLLAGLADRLEGVDYRDKNWLLMKSGQNLNFAVGSTVGSVIGKEWVPSYSYVALIINGDYRGLYILCENVKDSEARIDVKKTGYIVEMDAYWWNEDLYFTTPISESHPAKLTFKYPDAEKLTADSAEVAYIKDYITKVENALIAGEDVSDIMDLESFAKWLLGHDILASYDSGGSNMYMYKRDNTDASKLTMGPIWDFDSIYWSAEPWRTDKFARIREGYFFYMPYLLKNEEFCTVYRNLYTEARGKIISEVSATIDKYNTEEFTTLLHLEKERWGTSYWSVEDQKNRIIPWFEAHLAWMDENV